MPGTNKKFNLKYHAILSALYLVGLMAVGVLGNAVGFPTLLLALAPLQNIVAFYATFFVALLLKEMLIQYIKLVKEPNEKDWKGKLGWAVFNGVYLTAALFLVGAIVGYFPMLAAFFLMFNILGNLLAFLLTLSVTAFLVEFFYPEGKYNK